MAMALIQVAKDAGAEAVKFQFYTPEGMVGPQSKRVTATGPLAAMGVAAYTVETDRIIDGGPWSGQGMYDLYDKAQMPWEWGPRLKERCHELGVAFIASAYDVDGLDWLMANCVPDALKVASFEATDTPFVEVMAGQGVPLIVSLGMMEPKDRKTFKAALAQFPNPMDVALLHCVSAYPTPPNAARLGSAGVNLSFFSDVGPWFQVGFSDHTRGHAVACAAVAKGACVLEKHIQLHPSLKTADSHFSVTPSEFVDYCLNVKDAWEACQPVQGDPEKDSRQFRRAPGGKRGSYVGP